MSTKLDKFAKAVTELQDSLTSKWHQDINYQTQGIEAWLQLVEEQHKYNFDLWHQEDNAREPNADDSVIAQTKRNIDSLNQLRNDAITRLDVLLNESVFTVSASSNTLPWNSETIGSIVDRLSIASLKVFHMQEQVDRPDASAEHIQSCSVKLQQLIVQKEDLSTALQEFCNEIVAGRKQNKLYQQFKMYNDPSLNPKIYQSDKS